MKCENLTRRLDDYVDGALPRAENDEIEEHLGACPTCRKEVDELRGLLERAAGLPREITPERDLWPGIEGRLQRPGVLVSPYVLAAAATLIVALTATLTLMLSRSTDTTEAVLVPGVAPIEVSLRTPEAGVLEAEAEFERAAAGLLVELEARRESLSPETVASVEQNMRDIDFALREIRDALREDPANQDLVRLLGSAHRKKIRMLERVVRNSPTVS